MINARERVHDYMRERLEVIEGFEGPWNVHPWHQHETAKLYTVAGSLYLQLEGQDSVVLTPGSEFIVPAGVQHHSISGSNGWKFVMGRTVEAGPL